MNCQIHKGTISLYTISVLKDDGFPKKESAALMCKVLNKTFYLDLNAFRPDPRDILKQKKQYKVNFSLYNEPLIYLDDKSSVTVLRKIFSNDFAFANIR